MIKYIEHHAAKAGSQWCHSDNLQLAMSMSPESLAKVEGRQAGSHWWEKPTQQLPPRTNLDCGLSHIWSHPKISAYHFFTTDIKLPITFKITGHSLWTQKSRTSCREYRRWWGRRAARVSLVDLHRRACFPPITSRKACWMHRTDYQWSCRHYSVIIYVATFILLC